MTFDQGDFAARQEKIRERMAAEGFDAVIAYSNAKVRGCVKYLANYFARWTGAQCKPDGSYHMFGSCALLVSHDHDGVLLIDQPWDEDRAKLVAAVPETRYAENYGTEFGRLIAERGYKKVGIDNWFIYPAMHYLSLVELAPDATFAPTQLIEQVYKVKEPREIELIRKAEQAAMEGVAAGFAAVGVGVSEYEFALACEHALRVHGELELSANNIICGGANTATGTWFPTQESSYVMKSGDWALFDITPSYGGYAGDISRMVVAGSVGDLDPTLKKLYDVTLRMNEEVIAAIRPGVTPRKLNELAQGIADEGGFGPNKIGLLGHSLGVDIHDPPDYYYDDDPLEENMCITVEPCLLIPGVAGTRVEDVALVTADGCEVLTAESSKELRGTE